MNISSPKKGFVDNSEESDIMFYTPHRERGNIMNRITHGLDLPDDISERNNKIIMEQLGISEKDIEDDSNEYLCDDRNQLEEAAMIRNMTDEEWDEYMKVLREKQEQNKELKE